MTDTLHADSAQAREQDERRAAPAPEQWQDLTFNERCALAAQQHRQSLPGRLARAIEQMERRIGR